MTVREILQRKGDTIWSVAPDQTVYEALGLMAERNVGAILVLEDGKVVGMLSERDYARQVVLKGKASRDVPVRDIMTSKVVSVTPGQTVDDCMALMTDKHIRHLPVLENDKVAGLISIGDVVKAVISEKEAQIEQLESYITQG
jgi:CBS domain-containing protein